MTVIIALMHYTHTMGLAVYDGLRDVHDSLWECSQYDGKQYGRLTVEEKWMAR